METICASVFLIGSIIVWLPIVIFMSGAKAIFAIFYFFIFVVNPSEEFSQEFLNAIGIGVLKFNSAASDATSYLWTEACEMPTEAVILGVCAIYAMFKICTRIGPFANILASYVWWALAAAVFPSAIIAGLSLLLTGLGTIWLIYTQSILLGFIASGVFIMAVRKIFAYLRNVLHL